MTSLGIKASAYQVVAAGGGLSVRFDSSSDTYGRTGDIATGALTYCLWAKIKVDTNAVAYMMGFNKFSPEEFTLIGLHADGVSARWECSSTAQQNITVLTVDVWYFLCCATSGSGTTGKFYWMAEGAGSLSSTSPTTMAGCPAGSAFILGSSQYVQPFNGEICAVKVWAAELNSTEINTERQYYLPQRTANLWAAYSFKTGAQTNDESGNSRTLTANGTPSTGGAGPSIT